MMVKKSIASIIAAAFIAVGAASLLGFETNVPITGSVQPVGHADIATLKTAYEEWRQTYEANGGSPETLKLLLGHSKVLSKEATAGRGKLELNLMTGAVAFTAQGLNDGRYELWLHDSAPGATQAALPESDDRFVSLGIVEVNSGKGALSAQLNREELAGFTLESAYLTKAGQSPVAGIVIGGSPELMQKLYYASQFWPMANVGGENLRQSAQTPKAFDFLLPKAAQAAAGNLDSVLGAQVALGRKIFHNETFNGNGRNCGTCHRADNNFTLDPNYISQLPPSDPLFVFERSSQLAGLENSTLLRKYGLVLANIDGPGTDVFRSVPYTLALSTTIKGETLAAGGEFAADESFANAVGWSGDGAPASGSLRDFTLGAITQHFPKTLARVAGQDFRVPTAAELDAVQAYMLALGRSKDYPLYQLTFRDPLTEAGKQLFDTKQNPCTGNTQQAGKPAVCPGNEQVVIGATANCNGCHQNAGGRSSTTKANPTRDTGIENMKLNAARLVEAALAFDGGFGQNAKSDCGPNHDQSCFGDGRFNTPSLIEAADTAPYFHNNSVTTLEEAIGSYNNDAFNHSPSAVTSKLANRQIKLDASQIVAVASFLRAINVVENIRESNRLATQAMQLTNPKEAKEFANLAAEETEDAIRVLREGVFSAYGDALKDLEDASRYAYVAKLSPSRAIRNALLQRVIDAQQRAKNAIASCDPKAKIASTVQVTAPLDGQAYSCDEIAAAF